MQDPTPGASKAVASGVAGALTVIVCWCLETFGHVVVPAEVAIAVTTVFGTGAVYFTPHQVGGPK